VHDIPREFNVDFLVHDLNHRNIKGSKAVGEPPLMLAISVWTAVKDAIYRFKKTKNKNHHQQIPLQVPATQEVVLMEMQK
jgi:xanthine dehydrogenase large subunit